jgi:hypothetical protein
VWGDGDLAFDRLLTVSSASFRLQSVKACASSFTVLKAVFFILIHPVLLVYLNTNEKYSQTQQRNAVQQCAKCFNSSRQLSDAFTTKVEKLPETINSFP